ncbi:MAG TPA: DUF4340 domain-containing protein [Acidobacteriaceae bacterium]
MKFRGLLIAALVLLVLGGVLYWSEHRKPAEEHPNSTANASPVIVKLDPPTIAKLTFKKRDTAPVTLVRKDANDWQITEPKPLDADQNAVSTMLLPLSSLNSERVVEDRAADLKQYGLEQPALELDFTEKNNKSQQLRMGDDTPTGGSTYAMLAGDPRVFTISSSDKASLDKTVNDLRDKHLLKLQTEKISRIDLVRKNQEIKFGRDKNGWQILKPRPLRADSIQIDELVTKLTDAKMDLSGIGTQDSAGDFARATPVTVAKVTGDAGTQELQIRKSKDLYYAKSSVIDGTYKVDSDLGQALDKSLDDFRNKKLFDFSFNQPNKIELHDGSKSYVLTRSGQDWFSEGKKVDAGKMESLISKLRDLTAAKFPNSGFTTPQIIAAVTSQDGKLVEKVLIAKSGDGYIAKRENEPSLYQFDASTVDGLQKAVDTLPSAGK